ncbi:MAG: helix-turn-helix domain-containing protein [Polyangiaceae bacterium]|nr:helix-turn-helix domain-containing protein [Polyangiaceae bacterium]
MARHLLDADPSSASFQLKLLGNDLASHLNSTSDTLSRPVRRLAESGLIELEAGQPLRRLDTERRRALARGDEEA